MTDPILRHAGSAGNAHGPSSYGNRQFMGVGNTRHCVRGDHWVQIGGGWRRQGPLKLWTCPGCQKGKK